MVGGPTDNRRANALNKELDVRLHTNRDTLTSKSHMRVHVLEVTYDVVCLNLGVKRRKARKSFFLTIDERWGVTVLVLCKQD
jgi:hypothetical protein